ncbi:helix-turn-helix domain-containing protein [Priestia filamentosa]|uniref:helix-turn-helix domain-containing protein n=1 Tax=Priestia filamentosa TaxID=1402861 RepID=UPI003F1356B9
MFGDRLTSLRKSKKLTQAELSERLNIPRSTYSNYEAGKREPDFETLKKFSSFYEVSIDYILGNSDEPRMSDEPIRFDELHFHGIDKLSDEEIEDVKKQALERIEYHLWKKERQGNKNNE